MKHRWMWGIALIVLLAGAIALVPAGFRLAQPRTRTVEPSARRPRTELPDIQQLTRVEEQGEVAVSVAFLNPSNPLAFRSDLGFSISLDTHTVDLSRYDLTTHSVLTNDRGETISSGFTWKAEIEGAHHRSGELRVKNRAASGRPFWTTQVELLRLELKELADVPVRRFEWRFP
ncbi:MAG: hypothetical protein ACM3XZ_04235 [Betaproteobacteria bacterium]